MMNRDEYSELLRYTHDFLSGGYLRAEPSASSDPTESSRQLNLLAEQVASCTRCSLAQNRNKTVFGVGVLSPLLMVIGEGPGADEDAQGLPFVGKAGQYLDKWLEAIELSRDKNVYIANIVKCRPPCNRNPTDDECRACIGYLYQQIELVRPRAIFILGAVAMKAMLGVEDSMKSSHGRVQEIRGIPAMISYHPSAVLRNPSYRSPVWEDLKKLRKLLDSIA